MGGTARSRPCSLARAQGAEQAGSGSPAGSPSAPREGKWGQEWMGCPRAQTAHAAQGDLGGLPGAWSVPLRPWHLTAVPQTNVPGHSACSSLSQGKVWAPEVCKGKTTQCQRPPTLPPKSLHSPKKCPGPAPEAAPGYAPVFRPSARSFRSALCSCSNSTLAACDFSRSPVFSRTRSLRNLWLCARWCRGRAQGWKEGVPRGGRCHGFFGHS